MSSRRIIIGDVHGQYDALLQLMEAIAPQEKEPVYFLGDLIDRGPNSAQVVEFVRQHRYRCLLGNHEQMLLEVLGSQRMMGEMLPGWLYNGGNTTLFSYNHKIPQDHIDWLKTLPLYLDLGDIWLVHAGVHPHLPLEEQDAAHFCWIRDEFHSMPEPFFSDKLIITGHTITFTFPGVNPGQLVAGAGWLDIDTGAYHSHSNWLTGLDITNRLVYQVNTKDKTLRKFDLEDITTSINPAEVYTKRMQPAP
ncbi:metallophosphoesterase [Microcystis aeruginosa NIES-3806]|uniref:Serine/threonine protein phosphatase n=2 Tax=Microcystis aeruginosa TaxID=1126 RepID=A0A0F6U4R2_MICAE|nr:metallophosphoesterase family protein [Microcystis aeruginosa]AKE64679.1 serine/threonine protein phosphatase [Microcystis aeruginosa NIES-2549]AOC53078.1 serine/threonine protein phosphatase [Microcystis aeruginosa NIES-2481]GCL48135.1 metallophosphoesterase [Microcystis aeruginosa NIES-3787]GCL54950.1 metallophosphoesterase [Microcystis aeruginosa NIES-3806]